MFLTVYCVENLINNKQYVGIAVDYGKTHSEETRKKMRLRALQRDPKTRVMTVIGKSLKGSDNFNAKPVLVNGKKYGCIKDAALELGCHPETLRKKFRKYRQTNSWPIGWADL